MTLIKYKTLTKPQNSFCGCNSGCFNSYLDIAGIHLTQVFLTKWELGFDNPKEIKG